MLDVNSGTSSLSGKNAGRPITQSAPRTGPTTEPSPPITTIDTSCSESSTRKKRSVNGTDLRPSPASSAPPMPAMPPASANAISFVAGGDDRVGGGACRGCRAPRSSTARPRAAQPGDEDQAREHDEQR